MLQISIFLLTKKYEYRIMPLLIETVTELAMSDMNQELRAEIEENIRRLENTKAMGCWQDGYIKNLEADIASYKDQLARL